MGAIRLSQPAWDKLTSEARRHGYVNPVPQGFKRLAFLGELPKDHLYYNKGTYDYVAAILKNTVPEEWVDSRPQPAKDIDLDVLLNLTQGTSRDRIQRTTPIWTVPGNSRFARTQITSQATINALCDIAEYHVMLTDYMFNRSEDAVAAIALEAIGIEWVRLHGKPLSELIVPKGPHYA